MPTVIVHGFGEQHFTSQESCGALKVHKQLLMEQNMLLVDMMEAHGARVRPFLCSSDIFHAEAQQDERSEF